MSQEDEGYLPTPEYHDGAWHPYNYAGREPLGWPEGFDPASLPIPPYRRGDRVPIKIRTANGVSIHHGRIQKIALKGGAYTGSQEKAIEELYFGGLRYIISMPSGHGTWVRENQIIKEQQNEH